MNLLDNLKWDESFKYKDLSNIYERFFSLHYFGNDIGTKLALISLICFLKYKVSLKKPNTTHYSIIKSIIKDEIPEDIIISLSIICENMSYQCTQFPLFGIEPRNVPEKIKEILRTYLPF